MNQITNFFLVCSGANKSILNRTPTEINRYVGIGATIFFTGIFAMLASSYAIYTVFNSYVAACIFGIIWGLMIFNLDRYIVSSLKKSDSILKDMLATTPRLILALIIAIVIAKPLELKIFDTEIRSEIALMEQEKKITQEALVRSRFQGDIDILKSEIKQLKEEILRKANLRNQLTNEAIKEADGTGGSMKRNLGPIYNAKKKEADIVKSELVKLEARNNNLIQDKLQKISIIESNINNALGNAEEISLNGIAGKIEALDRLSLKSEAIWMASLFIMLLFIAIETAPLFVKLITIKGPYDYVLDKHELEFQMQHRSYSTLLKNKVENKIRFETTTLNAKTNLAIDAEKEISKQALHNHLESIKDQPLIWKDLLRKGKLFQLD